MKKFLLFAVLVLQFISVSAKKITSADSLRVFYTQYFLLDVKLEDENQLNLLVSSSSTQDFYTAWYKDVYDIGLYDPLTRGAGGDSKDVDFMIKSLSVIKEKDYYTVSFKFHGWQGNINEYTVYVYVNKEGKISHTRRPTDGYITPEE